MNQLDLCRSYLEANTLAPRSGTKPGSEADGPVVTISRQAGARANSIAEALVGELLRSRTIPQRRPWTVFNQNLLEHVIREHHLPERTAAYFPEDKTREAEAVVAELLGLHSGRYNSARKMAETIRNLAVAGNAVVVGRGANHITLDIRHSLQVRLVGSRDRRVGHFAEVKGLSVKEAAREVDRLDVARRRYVKEHFGHEIEDPRFYDVVINTDEFDNAAVCRLLRLALEEKCG